MRRKEKEFKNIVKASVSQLAEYEEEKNKDYSRHFGDNVDAILSDFRRQNYFLLRDESFQSKRDHEFSPLEVFNIQSKIKNFSKSEQLSKLIQFIGGQAFQAPLSVLEFLSFRHENETISTVAKFDLSLYFLCGEELRYINLNFSYAVKSGFQDKNYIVDERTQELIEISDRECQILSAALNALSNDVQRYMGFAINKIDKNSIPKSSAERAAKNISLAFKSSENVDLTSLLTLVEAEIHELLREYLLLRRSKIIWNSTCKEEFQALENLKDINFCPVLGGGDYMAFLKHWRHLQVSCPEDENTFEKLRAEWHKTHSLGDLLIILSPENQQWLGFKIAEGQKLESWTKIEDPMVKSALSEITPANVKEYNFSILRDFLDYNTRAVRQLDLVLCKNAKAIENLLLPEEPAIRALLKLKKPLNSKTREALIRKIFNGALKSELRLSGFIRDQVPAKQLNLAIKMLIQHLQSPNLMAELTDGEFLQWVNFSVDHFFENLKRLSGIVDVRVREYYKAQFLPKIEQEKNRIMAKRRKRMMRMLGMELNMMEITRFSRDLVREACKIFMGNRGQYENMSEAFYALYSDSLRASLQNAADVDELIYRLVYMKPRDSVNASFFEILLCEAIHLKISNKHHWTPDVANVFRAKSPEYLHQAQQILEEVSKQIEFQVMEQGEEREKAASSCDEMRQKACELLKCKPSSENYVMGAVMNHVAEDLSNVVGAHYKNHYVRVDEGNEIPKDRSEFLKKINNAIDARLARETALNKYEHLAERIKTHALNFFLTVFSLGIVPLTRKFVLKKPAFFSTMKSEVAEELRNTIFNAS